ncbi:MAG TPA: FAD-dependent monooxygenase [Pseudonocardia sp.]|nr:FAD-dependent monooxygenase [Pseudonocardia sp.]
MRVAVAGGGPGGLFLATLIRRADPSIEVTVFERNRADDTFGFGVVFSDRTLAGIHEADPVLREALSQHGRHWDQIEVRLKGERIRCGGNGMAAVVRRTLLALMQARARDVGAQLRFSTEVGLDDLGQYDLVVAADGAGSRIREQVGADLDVRVETATAKFIWFGTDYLFEGLTFVHERGPDGVFAVHGYPISDEVSTFIVETDEASWRQAGLDEFDVSQPPGPSDLRTKDYLEKLFAEQIDGRRLLVNNSRWGNFRTRRTGRWHTMAPRPVAFLGDAVHTAHFSVGSGTKMAMEDAVALAGAITENPGDLGAALVAYEQAAQPSVRRIQDSARPSLAWWEHFGRYHDEFEPWQFAYHFLSRSITDSRLARRDPEFVAAGHRAWVSRHGAEPLETPFTGPGWSTPTRLVTVSEAGGVPTAVAGGVPTAVAGGVPASAGVAGGQAPPAGDEGGQPLPAGGQAPLPLCDEPRTGPWGARVTAPQDETGLPPVFARLAELAGLGAAAPTLVAVHGGTSLTRMLLCEQARMHDRLPALLVEPGADRDQALTTVLSGRADLVGVTA